MYLNLQRINDSLVVCAEPGDFTVGEFITVGSVVFIYHDCVKQMTFVNK